MDNWVFFFFFLKKLCVIGGEHNLMQKSHENM